MALIHRCDRCGSDHKYGSDLYRVEIGINYSHALNRNDAEGLVALRAGDGKIPYIADLCHDCVVVALVALKAPK